MVGSVPLVVVEEELRTRSEVLTVLEVAVGEAAEAVSEFNVGVVTVSETDAGVSTVSEVDVGVVAVSGVDVGVEVVSEVSDGTVNGAAAEVNPESTEDATDKISLE